MGRAPCCDKANVKRGPWSPEEDATLKDYLNKHGTAGNWISLPQRAGLKRCGKSCRLRWLNYLRPDIKHGAFSEEEDNIIISLYYKLGSRWSVIAANLQGRTDNDVKNHWNTKLKKKLFGGSNNNNTNTFNKFNSSSKFHVPFTYTNIINNTNNVTNPTIFQPHHPLSSTPNSPKPSYVDNNNTNYTFNHVNYWPSFSTLLAQCNSNTTISTTNSPMSLLPNFTMEDNPFTNDPTRNPDCYYIEEGSSASGSSSVVYGSSLEDDPFFAELGGFGSNQQLMMNPTCGYGDQEDIKPQGLGQSVIN